MADAADQTLLERLGLQRQHGIGEAGWGWTLLAGLVSIVYFFPVLWIIMTAFKTHNDALAVPPKLGRVAIVASPDGRTNALGLPYPEVFRPLYGPDSARRFRGHVLELGFDFEELALPNLVADVDTLADLGGLGPRGGARTRALVEAIAR